MSLKTLKGKIKSSRYLLAATIALPLITVACKKEVVVPPPPPPIPVSLKTLQMSQQEISTEFVGNLEAKQSVTVKAESNGRIQGISFNEGDLVRTGSVLFQIRPEQSRAEVDAAIANVDVQRASFDNAQAEVRASESEVLRLVAEVKRQEAEVVARKADLDLAEVNYKRTKLLVEQGVYPKQNLDDRTRERKSAIANLDASKQSLEAAKKALTTAQQRSQSAQARANQALAQITNAQANVQVKTEDLGFNRIEAPITGIVDNTNFKIGDYVSPGTELTRILNNSALDLQINVPVERLKDLKSGLLVEMLDTNNKVIKNGQISFIAPTINNKSQTILAKATFANSDNSLKDGQYVRTRVIWSRIPGVLIPTTAISKVAGKNFVFVSAEKESKQVVVQKPVTLGTIQGDSYQVIDGVKPGDAIAVSNILKLKDGAAIEPSKQ